MVALSEKFGNGFSGVKARIGERFDDLCALVLQFYQAGAGKPPPSRSLGNRRSAALRVSTVIIPAHARGDNAQPIILTVWQRTNDNISGKELFSPMWE